MCNEAVRREPISLAHVPDHLKTQEMCERVVEKYPYNLKFVPDHFKTQGMCNKAVEKYPYNLKFVPDQYKTQEMCDNTVRRKPWSLEYVPDWFVTREWMLMWYDDDEDKLFKWHDSYIRQKAQKVQIKTELMPITWHPSRHRDWCMSEDEKKKQKNYGHKHRLFLCLMTGYKKNFCPQNLILT